MKKQATKPGTGWRVSKEQQTRILLLFALLFASVIIFREYLFGQRTLVFNDIGSDTYQLYTMQFASVINHLREGTFSFWDFTNGFGVNQFNLNLFDPSEMLVFAMGWVLGPARVLFYLVLVQILKILAAGYVFYHYLSCFSLGRQAKFAAAFAYGLNGYLIVWGQHYQFGMVTIYLPLMLLFCEAYLQQKKIGRCFPAAVFLCAVYSVYFSFMALSGVGVYLLIRSFMLPEKSLPARIRVFLMGCVQILLGIGMAMGVFLPMAACILGVSGRVGAEETSLFSRLIRGIQTFPYEKYFQSVFVRFFSSAFQYSGELADGSYEYLYNYYEDPVLFTGILSVILNLQLLVRFWKKPVSRRKKAGVYAGAFLILFSLMLPAVGTLLNGFTAYTGRFSFLLMPFLLLGMAFAWQELKEQHCVSRSMLVLCLVWLVAAAVIGYEQSVLSEYRRNALLTGILGAAMILCILGIRWSRRERMQQILFSLLAAFLMVNMVSEADTNYEGRVTLLRSDTGAESYEEDAARQDAAMESEDPETAERARMEYPQKYFQDLYGSGVNEALAYLKEQDTELYRIEKDFILGTTTTSMDSLAQGYRGVTSYNSVQNQSIVDFLETVIPEVRYPDQNHFLFAGVVRDSVLSSFLGIRYLLSYDPNLTVEGYTLQQEFHGLNVYRNENTADFARFYSETISEDSFRELVSEETRNELLTTVLALPDGEDYSSMEELPTLSAEVSEARVLMEEPQDDSHLTGSLTAPVDGYVLFLVPYESGWTLTVDGQETEFVKGDLGFLACKVSEGEHSFSLTFQAPGLSAGLKLGGICWILYLLLYFPGVVPLYFRKVRMK